MTDEYISKDELQRRIDSVAMNYQFYSNFNGSESDLERQLNRWIEEKVTDGVKQAFQQLSTEIWTAPAGGLCLLCKDPTESEDEQN